MSERKPDIDPTWPADVQLLYLNLHEHCLAACQRAAPLGWDEIAEVLAQATADAMAQTIEDLGGVQVEADQDARRISFTIPLPGR